MDHCNCNYKQRSCTKTGLLGRISPSTKLIVYNLVMSPHFEYSATILFMFSESAIRNLQKNKTKQCVICLAVTNLLFKVS